MRILIMRTIAHNKIWEGIEPTCHYENQNYEFIKTWEPEIINYKLDQINYGIGIYSKDYFKYVSFLGVKASTDTIHETQPSLLNLKPIDDNSNSFIVDESEIIRIAFELNKKYNEFNRAKMFELDEKFISLKRKELGAKLPSTRYPSLCFSLDYRDVENIFTQFGVTLT